MSRARVPPDLRELVAADSRHRCGYCLMSERIVGIPMEVDHLVPEIHGGATERENLWLACPFCNRYKGQRTSAVDPVSQQEVSLFNPRTQDWSTHFAWVVSGSRIMGLTAIGRATAQALKLNRPILVEARKRWVRVGWHPPEDSD